MGNNRDFYLSIFNLMNAIVGAGMLSLPFAVKSLGILLYGVMLIVVGVIALYSIVLLLRMCDITGYKSYEQIADAAFGKKGMVFVVFCITLHTLGCLVGFLFVVKYELPSVVKALAGIVPCEDAWFTSPNLLVVLVVVFIVAPLSSAKDINFLGYTSAFAMICMIFCTIVIFTQYFNIPCPLEPNMQTEYWQYMLHSNCSSNMTRESYLKDKFDFKVGEAIEIESASCLIAKPIAEFYHNLPTQDCEVKFVSLTLASVYAIPTMVFAFQCHASVLPIYAELKQPSHQMRSASSVALTIVFFMYLFASSFGYLTFKDATGSELFVMYSGYSMTDPLTLLGRILVLCCVILSAPVLHFPCRKAIIVGIWGPETLPGEKKFSMGIWISTMVVILSVVLVMVLYVPNIKDVFGLGGATVATLLMIVMPSGLHYKLSNESYTSRMKRVNLGVVIIGILFGIFSVTLIIQDWTSKHHSEEPCQVMLDSIVFDV